MICRDGIYVSKRIAANETDNPIYVSGYYNEVKPEGSYEAVYIKQAKPTSHYEEPRYLQPLEQLTRALPPEARMNEDVNQA